PAVSQYRLDIFLEREFQPVGQGLQQPEGAHPVGAHPMLHPSHHPALQPDHEQCHDLEEHEDRHDLDDDEPQRVVGEQGPRGCHECLPHAVLELPPLPLRTVTTAPCPTPRLRRTVAGPELPGSHTTPGGRSAAATGSVIDPRWVDTVTRPPRSTPRSAAVVSDSRATAGRAVAAKCGSPTCIDPLSSSLRQVASSTLPSPTSGTVSLPGTWRPV